MLIKLPLAQLLYQTNIIPGDTEIWCFDPNSDTLIPLSWADLFYHAPDDYLETLIPTYQQSELQTFLRNRRILVDAQPIDSWDCWTYGIYMEDCMAPFFKMFPDPIDFPEFPTYEDALEAGLTEAIKFL